MYEGNLGEIDFGSSLREVRVSEGSTELSGVKEYFVLFQKPYNCKFC